MKNNAERARGLAAAELSKELRDTSEQMFRLRFQLSMGQADGLKKLRQLRKERARMLTVQRERELGKEVPQSGVVKAAKPAKAAAPKAAKKTAAENPAAAKKAAKPAVKKAAPKAAPKSAAKPKKAAKPAAAKSTVRKSSKG